MGVWQHDRVEIIANDQGNRTTPSYVAFTDSERLIGDAAKNQVSRRADCPASTAAPPSPPRGGCLIPGPGTDGSHDTCRRL